ncbi:MAG TPA: hypothetical protein DEF82_09840 [Crocinitomicaceae bacterium]|nr:GNAT family N-acetyltransferase [Flavobacteriales bacterium]HBW87015.1 hypothetical protein [Crocinitomicaceae bacterium]
MIEQVKAVKEKDINKLKEVIDSCGLFPSMYLDPMISDYLNNPSSSELWYAYHANEEVAGFIYCVPEKFTFGTYNLLAIGVSANHQRKGIAKKMLSFIEKDLKTRNARMLIIETSSDSAQQGARFLYDKLGYTKEAIIRGFWNEKEDKIIYLKKL